MNLMRPMVVTFFSAFLCGCGSGSSSPSPSTSSDTINQAVDATGDSTGGSTVSDSNTAAITAVVSQGDANAYSFSVTVRSPDIGCSQYADWWEVIQPDGTLIYRRILTHSHVDEQPFTRSGGDVAISADEEVIVRVHMNNLGYGEQVFSGSVSEGFTASALDTSFAQTLEFSEPLPDGCAF